MPLSEETKKRIAVLIEGNDVVLFMKGDRTMPQCGFSGKVVQILDGLLQEYHTVDVLADDELRDGIKQYSSWPTIPQLYVKGELIGGCDIITDLSASGDLHKKLGIEAPEREIPTIHLSDAAARRIREFAQRAPEKELHLSIDARFQAGLGLSPRQGDAVEVQAHGITVLMDLATARRADGVSIELVETPNGAGFKIDNPNAPGYVKPIKPAELKKLMDEGAAFELFDVRSPEEQAIARIAGARLLDPEAEAYIETLPKDTMLIFHCHHGGRSQSAAEHYRDRGFVSLHSVVGGIDAWSLEVDPSVPRY